MFFFSSQTPFTFGLNQRAPYTAGDRCLLCRCERKDGAVPSEVGMPGQNGTSQPNKTPSALLPLWVCSDCRRTVEKEDRHTALEQSLGVSHLLLKEVGFAVLSDRWLSHRFSPWPSLDIQSNLGLSLVQFFCQSLSFCIMNRINCEKG